VSAAIGYGGLLALGFGVEELSMLDHMQSAATISALPSAAVAPSFCADAPRCGSRVLIVDDHAVLRFGMQALLQAGEADLEVLEASCLQDAIAMFRETADIDLVLLDLNMSDCRGLQGVRQFKEQFPQARVAVLSATQDEFVARQAQALGAVAYLAKATQPSMLSQSIRSLLKPDAGRAGSGAARSGSYDRVAELGSRHLEILDLLLFGCSNQEISTATHLSLGTVKNYVSIILLALDVKSRSHLISLFR
jgi:DNA-binding NarL/FixJ family response regulator